MESASTNGWILGAKVGAEYSINENNAVEFGLKADRTDYGKILVNFIWLMPKRQTSVFIWDIHINFNQQQAQISKQI
ncbi:hypothetical protein [Campylobacter concisus]|uniref:hypothetical protein n=1 Tax=Campylobacter concisus TaxID=199 RepID=UPI001CB7DF96|nr:hypothetical protein [Campylobacter concisus]